MDQTADGVYFGMMSGTSLDGVDAVAVEFIDGLPPRPLAHVAREFPLALRDALLALQDAGFDEIAREAWAANQLAVLYAECCSELCLKIAMEPRAVRAIGVHGQTIRHRPELGYTRQTNNPALLAELTRIDVIADFRSRDVAAHGQGAPLVPAFHATLFGQPGQTRVICNIGGISNITVLDAAGRDAPAGGVRGFDCGPGNALLDYWVQRHTGQRYDDAGRFALQGAVLPALLDDLLDDAFFKLIPPKSTGRDLFNPNWLEAKLAQHGSPAPADVQATLTALTATAIARDVARHAPDCRALFVCGGGAFNLALLSALKQALDDHGMPAVQLERTDALGVPALQVEGFAFAWLARRFIAREPGNLPAVTGAEGLRVLGALYPR
jgi:anhydro-N-acetylmuramic acid kinase